MEVRLQIAMVCVVYTVSHPPPWRVRDGLAQSTDYLKWCEGEDETAGALQVLSPNEYLFKVGFPLVLFPDPPSTLLEERGV